MASLELELGMDVTVKNKLISGFSRCLKSHLFISALNGINTSVYRAEHINTHVRHALHPLTLSSNINSPHIPTLHLVPSLILPTTQSSMLQRVARHLRRRGIVPGSSHDQHIRLEVISGKDLQVLSERIPAGIYVSITLAKRRRWKSAIQVPSSNSSVAWGDTVTLSPYASSKLSVEIRASFELGRMLGNGEVIGKLKISWDKLLRHGNEPFELSFPLVRGVHPSVTLKAAAVNGCGNNNGELLNPIVDCKIAQDTDTGQTRSGEYVTSKRVSDLNDAVAHFDCTDQPRVRTPERGHPDRPLSLYYLTEALTWRHKKENTPFDIRESAQIYHELLSLCPEGTYLRSIAEGANGVDYVISGCNNLPIDASDEDIRLRRIVLEVCPQGHQHRLGALDQLSRSLQTHFGQCGSIVDIDESIQLGREAVSLCPEGHPNRGVCLNNLALSLRYYRFRHQGKSDDLNEGISLLEDALCLSPVGHESRDGLLDNLGSALLDRFNQRGEVEDINRAISLLREALTLRPPEHQQRNITLSNLALALITRYGKSHANEDLNEAIELCRESIRLTPYGHPECHGVLFNLSWALCSRFTRTQKIEDVEEAIELCQESLVTLPSLHPDRFYSYMRLQEAYLSRYQVQCNLADLSLAVENFRLASMHPTKGFLERIIIAYNWTVVAEQHGHESALEAYTIFLDLLDDHLSTRSSTISRQEATTTFHYARTLPVDASSCALRRHNLEKAVELVEQGRGQQWSLASRLRTPVEELESANQKLAHEFSELSKRVSDAAQGSAAITDRAAADQAAMKYRRCTEQWEAAVGKIRNIRGFSRFLLPLSYEDLQVAARDGPVIILIASKYSCNALIVPTSGVPHHVPFPSLTLADLAKLKDDFTMAIRHASLMGPTESRTELIVLLRKLWDEIMLPIVKVLGHDLKVKPRSRIWLCPTAAFTSIPLHAAHPSRTKADGSGRELSLEDIFICSYTPTLSALIRSRQAMKTHQTSPSFVAIGQSQPGAGQGMALATVDSELELVHKRVPPNVNFSTLSGDEATQAGALDALRRNTWVHLACHGKQDREQPYNSRFAMRDKPLTLLDIMENDTPQAEFAFLSACHTAVGDEETPDEVIHLAAGLQFSGFKSVIGTLWVVDDEVTKHVVEAFYENMFKDLKDGVLDCTKAAKALNYATHGVKKLVPLEQRIVFIHIGV
ncbi:CHAT domain-containing protein [Suillus paluster]|uniref:CHAT domain-containing protein n=1 Tax=Suillus paluster TaxID=48578 RepID=UPI001B8739F4|nr:CHAT domain-containing protein [Suillus paluster]KAG1724197.1 CHAT domain-containing protein [Suillus paluster]